MRIPENIRKHNFEFDTFDQIPQSVFDDINERLLDKQNENPLASVVAIAYNEEKNILKNLSSLADQIVDFPIEIIYVNNNSIDNTQNILDKVKVKSVLQIKKGCGHARQAGLDAAKGKYIISADADSIYPPYYVSELVKNLEKENIKGVYGLFSFLPDGKKSRFQLALYEFFKDIVIKLRSINRPELTVGGASFGFVAEIARADGWRTDIHRGEDGCMLASMKKRGKVLLITSKKSRVWTTSRTLDNDGSMFRMIMIRVIKEIKRLNEYFTVQKKGYITRDENKIKEEK